MGMFAEYGIILYIYNVNLEHMFAVELSAPLLYIFKIGYNWR